MSLSGLAFKKEREHPKLFGIIRRSKVVTDEDNEVRNQINAIQN